MHGHAKMQHANNAIDGFSLMHAIIYKVDGLSIISFCLWTYFLFLYFQKFYTWVNMVDAWCNGKLSNGMNQMSRKTHSYKEISKNMFCCYQGLDKEQHLMDIFHAVIDGKVLFKS